MSEVLILPVKPGTINEADKAKLTEAGIVVIEVEKPKELQLLRAQTDLSVSELLVCAATAIHNTGYDDVRVRFATALAKAIVAKSARS